MPFQLPALPYEYGALAPVISEETMSFHHDKHHKAYVDKLNAAVSSAPDLNNRSLVDILRHASKQSAVVRNNAGGHWNHSFFWPLLTPVASTQPSHALQTAIDAFGGLEKLKEEFNAKGAGQFGSGWAWVIKDETGALRITSTPNQDNPIMDDAKEAGIPILGNDVWEHAYYLTYKNDRLGYLKAWWQVVNWEQVSRHYEASSASDVLNDTL